MNDILLGMLLSLVVVAPIGLAMTVYALAQMKILFTAPKEAKAEFVMAGNAVKRMLLVWKKHHVTADGQIVDGNPPLLDHLRLLNPLNWMEPWGIYWIGLWPFYKIYTYDFVWTEEMTDDSGKIMPHTRRAIRGTPEGQTSYIKVNDTNYFIVANDVKTKDGVPLKFILLLTVRIENPYKALFMGEEWLERTGGAVTNMTVRYCGALSYEQVVASTPAELIVIKNGTEVTMPKKTLEDLIMMLGNEREDDVQGGDTDLLILYGVRIVAAKLHSFDFADDAAAKEYRTATTQKYVAEQKGLGEAAEATGKAAAIRTLADAEKYRIDTIYEPVAGNDKDARMQIRKLEALEKSGASGGNQIVVPDELLGLARKFITK